jgi:hypothetical protein
MYNSYPECVLLEKGVNALTLDHSSTGQYNCSNSSTQLRNKHSVQVTLRDTKTAIRCYTLLELPE